jgi:hypothetical protein
MRVKTLSAWENPCWGREEIDLPAGHATIIKGYESDLALPQSPGAPAENVACPARPYDLFIAHVYVGSTMLEIAAPGASDRAKSPYDTLQGMEVVVRALQPREPSQYHRS